MGKIVAVACSPRPNGISSHLTDAFLDGAMGLSTNIVTLHRPMKFKSIRDCNRCMECKNTGRCVIDDDILTVLDDIVDADCVVFSTPVFFDGPTALYKVIEDRMYAFLDANKVSFLEKGKKAVLIVTSTYPESDLESVSKTLAKNLEIIGFEMMGIITYCDNYGKDPVEENDELIAKVKALGKQMRNTPVV